MTEKIRALYVDDESDLLITGKLFLERLGDFSITTASGAAEGIRLLQEQSFDVIISAHQMPHMNGISLLKNLKPHGDNTPFILFT
ncbi:MAG: histidine kinase, partial [Methanomicrobiales archaeon HGW-Methanomicrobiales-4]